ncbi:MAG: septation regulator SpoVG [Candidatus Atribacteria bacterium]
MEITDVRLRKIETEGKLRAYVSITFDDSFVVHDLRVIDGNKGMFVAMPSKRLPNGDHKDIAHPINTEIREKIQNAVLDVYHKEAEAAPQYKEVEPEKKEEAVEEHAETTEEKEEPEEEKEEPEEKKEEGLF